MEGKKSFILYTDLITVVDKLPDEIAGKLFKIILKYVNDKEICIEDILLEIAFEPIKQQLKRDLDKWNTLKEKRKEAGRKGGINSGKTRSNASKNEANKANKANASFVKQNQANEAVTVNDTVTVNVNDTVTVNNILLEKESKGGLAPLKIEDQKKETFELASSEEERKKIAVKKERKKQCEEVIRYFNEKCSELPAVQKVTDKRISCVNSRIKEFGKDKVIEVIDMTSESGFMNGENKQNWFADFDWIMNPTHFIKILEGNYKNKKNVSAQQDFTINR